MQEDVAKYVCDLSENFPNALLISLNESAKSGDDLPSDKAIEPLRELLIQCCDEVSAGTLTEEEAAKRFNTSANSDEYSDLFSPQLLELQNAIATRRSPGQAALSSSLLDHVDTSSFVGTIVSTTKILPATQTLHVIAALLSSDDNSATTNDLCAIAMHMDKVDRTYPLKHGLVKLLALGARSDSKMDTMAASTLTRLLTDSDEGRVVLSILKSNHISLVLAYQMGYNPQSIANKDHWRLMSIALLRSQLVENLEDLSNKTISKVLTSCGIVDEDQKKAVTNQLQSFQASLKRLSYTTAKRYNVGKQFKISDEHIESLSALPAITNQADLSMQMVKSVTQIPVIDILTKALADTAIKKHNEEATTDRDVKYSSLEELKISSTNEDEMEIDLEGSMMDDTGDYSSSSTSIRYAAAAASNLKSNDATPLALNNDTSRSRLVTKSQPVRKRSSQTTAQSSATEPPKQKKNIWTETFKEAMTSTTSLSSRQPTNLKQPAHSAAKPSKEMYSFFGGNSQSSNSQSSTTQSSKESKAGMYSFFGAKSSTAQPTKRKKKENDRTTANGGGSNKRKTNVWTKVFLGKESKND